MDQNHLAERFRAFAEKECKGSSHLYYYLSMEIAEDCGLLELSSHAAPGQPVPNLLFGAVHYLLMRGPAGPLGDYYPTLSANPLPPETSFPYFREFCAKHRVLIMELLKTRLVQTNEIRRCAYLFPVFKYIYEKTNRPLALIEIGTSAGFQLLWDKYSYSYGSFEIYGNEKAEVKIEAEIVGSGKPEMSPGIPPVASRHGIDLHINDVSIEEDSLWMKALIWPEHHERRQLFEEAVRCMKENRKEISFMEGDGPRLIPEIARKIPEEAVVVVFHTHVANQMPRETKKRLLENVKAVGAGRDIFHLYNNMTDGALHLDSFLDGEETTRLAAVTDGHGRWFEWLLGQS